MGTASSIPLWSRVLQPSLRPVLRPLVRGVVLVVLCGVLWGCGWVNPAPPRAVVAEAVAQKVAQTQVELQRQLGLEADDEARGLPQASGIRITEHHWMTIHRQPTVTVSGTYHLKGGGLGWGQQRQARPFSLSLRRAGTDQWVVVNPVVNPVVDAAMDAAAD